MIGRAFRAEDDRKGAAAVAIISESLWRHHLSRDPAILGRGVMLDGQVLTVVGVMPEAFQFPIQADRVDVWLPFDANSLIAQWKEIRGARFMHAVGHLRRGVTIEQAQSELTTISSRLSAAYPTSNSDIGARVTPFQSLLVHDGVMAYSVAQRRREIGIRMALGARASDVRALVVSQALRMGLMGAGVGVAGALLTTRVLEELLFGVKPNDPATFAASCVMLLAVLLVAAYMPARRATRVDPLVALRAD
jgi:hypothetical protein